ncbi:MAG: SMP-30/gluconolactonase/LRE family protein [Ekhidna sp.]|nr:SMP-30/gluconolactonase/LRE family protein [Ekhidna sp.]
MELNVSPIFDIIVDHGEGPVWDPVSQKYYWVNLIEGSYLIGDPQDRSFRSFNIGEPLGVMALAESGIPVVATANGFGVFDQDKNVLSLFDPSPESDQPELRFNDGTVDSEGRFYAGTMLYDGSAPKGRLYRLNKDQSFTEFDKELRIPNGMGWNKEKTVFYMIDTLQFKMFAYDYDITTGNLTNRRVFMTFEENDLADGMTIDTEGCFWIAFYGEGKVVKYSPEGEKLLQIDVPAPYTTSCCFGGPKMNQLFITTSKRDLDDADKSKYPLSGSCFIVDTDTVGIADPRVKIDL